MNNRARIAIIATLTVVFVGAILIREGQRRSAAPPPAEGPGGAGGAPSAPAAALPRLVDLGSTTCIPCKQMAPILEELRQEYEGQFAVEVIDVRMNRTAGELYGIRVIPTQIFFDATGKERFRHEGFMAKADILAKWGELGVTLGPAVPKPAGQTG